MESVTKTKVCWNCEGRLSEGEGKCPYCGSDQAMNKVIGQDPHATPYRLVKPQDEAQIPIPAYRPHQVVDALQEQVAANRMREAPTPPYRPSPAVHVASDDLQAQVAASRTRLDDEPSLIAQEAPEPQALTQQELQRTWLGSLILSLAGSTFLLFGLALYLFGTEGVFQVRWNSNWWPVYLSLSLPMLVASFYLSRRLRDE